MTNSGVWTREKQLQHLMFTVKFHSYSNNTDPKIIKYASIIGR